jgi:sugar fermentation stimulation protein A
LDFPPLVPGSFVRRDNRFRATVIVGGEEAWAHVPNSGRLEELFTPGRLLWLSPAGDPARKTAYDLRLVDYDGTLVSVDARLPNQLLAESLADGSLPDLAYPETKPEANYGDSRLDFRLSGPQGTCWLETKSVTLVTDGLAQFPDAPTARGRKHLLELIRAREMDHRAVVAFIIQRPDASQFTPHRQADPSFAAALEQAAAAGVEVRAFTCDVSRQQIAIASEIPVRLP